MTAAQACDQLRGRSDRSGHSSLVQRKGRRQVVACLVNAGFTQIYTVVNRLRGDLVMSGEMLTPTEIFSLIGQTALGIIPDDDSINCLTTAEGGRRPYRILADNLHLGTAKMYDCLSRYKGILGRMRRSIKRKV